MDSPPRPSPPPSCDATTSRAAASERACVAAEWARWLPRVLDSQCQDATHRDHGGFAQHHLPGWCDGRHAAYILARLMAVRLWHAEVARAKRKKQAHPICNR
ncbi:MAG: hypothetical protein LBK99_12490, partial [Opitutaceae bacterium]|nr:hypothetical protein [Opitutaceae bacterium]